MLAPPLSAAPQDHWQRPWRRVPAVPAARVLAATGVALAACLAVLAVPAPDLSRGVQTLVSAATAAPDMWRAATAALSASVAPSHDIKVAVRDVPAPMRRTPVAAVAPQPVKIAPPPAVASPPAPAASPLTGAAAKPSFVPGSTVAVSLPHEPVPADPPPPTVVVASSVPPPVPAALHLAAAIPAPVLVPSPIVPVEVQPASVPGLLLIVRGGDTLSTLYDQVYRGVVPPPFEAVAAANPKHVRPGDVLTFPPPPGGWKKQRTATAAIP
jgi:hypothetical protein